MCCRVESGEGLAQYVFVNKIIKLQVHVHCNQANRLKGQKSPILPTVPLEPGQGSVVTQGHGFCHQWKSRVHILAPFRRYGCLKVESRRFYLPHPHLTPRSGGTPQNFGIKLAVEKL